MSVSPWESGASSESKNDRRHEGQSWVGREWVDLEENGPPKTLLALLLVALLVALAVASLRIDLIRIRYALGETLKEETRLVEERRALIVEKRSLRDPAILAARAAALGFRAPDRRHEIVDPWPSASPRGIDLDLEALPQVAAGPPEGFADTAPEPGS